MAKVAVDTFIRRKLEKSEVSMTPNQWKLLEAVAVYFHQDFSLFGPGTRFVLAAHARGLPDGERQAFYTSLAALLQERASEAGFRKAFWSISTGSAPARAEVEDFLTWVSTPEGALEIASPGPLVSSQTVSVDMKTGRRVR